MKKSKKTKIISILVVVGLCYFVYILYTQQLCLDQSNAKYAQLEKNVHGETKKKEQLMREKEQINSNEFTEKIAREKLGYVKDGEKIFVDTNK